MLSTANLLCLQELRKMALGNYRGIWNFGFPQIIINLQLCWYKCVWFGYFLFVFILILNKKRKQNPSLILIILFLKIGLRLYQRGYYSRIKWIFSDMYSMLCSKGRGDQGTSLKTEEQQLSSENTERWAWVTRGQSASLWSLVNVFLELISGTWRRRRWLVTVSPGQIMPDQPDCFLQ